MSLCIASNRTPPPPPLCCFCGVTFTHHHHSFAASVRVPKASKPASPSKQQASPHSHSRRRRWMHTAHVQCAGLPSQRIAGRPKGSPLQAGPAFPRVPHRRACTTAARAPHLRGCARSHFRKHQKSSTCQVHNLLHSNNSVFILFCHVKLRFFAQVS
jgi:hypothetical protein